MSQTLNFPNVSPAQFAKIQEAMGARGLPIPANQGEISSHGVEGTYYYAEGNLEITVNKKPFLVTMGYVIGQIHDAVEALLV